MMVFGYLMTFCAIIFWVFRIIVTFTTTMNINFPIQPMNTNFEIILLFITLICIVLISKRKILGALAYLIAYVSYFGMDIYKSIQSQQLGVNTFASIIGIIIPLLIFIEIGINNGSKNATKDKKTDWYFKNDELNREYDERADKNQYKF